MGAESKAMTLLELHDAIAKAIADAQGHGMREKCARHADAVLQVVAPQLLEQVNDAMAGMALVPQRFVEYVRAAARDGVHPRAVPQLIEEAMEVLATSPIVRDAVVIDAKYDNVLVPFARLMARELHANAGKGDRPGWLRMTPATGMLEIYYHAAKLQKAVKDDNGAGIREYAADVANMAMMLLDLCGGLPVGEHASVPGSFQARVSKWMDQCFLPSLYSNMTERGDRLLEEVLELLQSKGYDRTRIATLVDYVWGRPVGEPAQEVGGVMVTLAGFCWIAGLDMHTAGEAELARINTPEVMDKIRHKQEAKNALHFDTPLPGLVGTS